MQAVARRGLHYGVAILAVALALALSLLLWPWIQRGPTPLLFAAVTVSAWYGGLGPGLLATALSALVRVYLFVRPEYSLPFGPDEFLQSGVFVLVALLIVSLHGSRLRAVEKHLQALAREHEARAASEQANRDLKESLSAVSHELRAPVTAVLGWAQMLRSGALDGEAANHAVEVIERNARLQAHLVRDLSDAALITAGKLRLDVRHVDLAEVARAAVETVSPAAAAKGIRIEYAADAAPGQVSGDPLRLQQVVVNLLANAVKFTPAGGRVGVRLERAGHHAQLTVHDTGVGIAEEFLPHIFERFRQGDSQAARSQGGFGLGLGLALARELVEMHGGTIRGESAGEGEGATFIVRLPLAGSQVEAPTTNRARPPAHASPGELLTMNLREAADNVTTEA